MIPKAELHVHLEGTAPPELIRRLAERNGMPVPEGVFKTEDEFAWVDFLDFLRTYDLAASVVRTPADYRDVTFEYLSGCAAEGAIYVEVIASPDHAAAVGLSDEDHYAGIAQGIDDARAETGIEGRIIMSCVRHFGPEKARDVARRTVEGPHPYVTGFGMGGDEAWEVIDRMAVRYTGEPFPFRPPTSIVYFVEPTRVGSMQLPFQHRPATA